MLKKITFLLILTTFLNLSAANSFASIGLKSLETQQSSILFQDDYNLRYSVDVFSILHIDANTKFEKISIYNVIGQPVINKKLDNKSAEIDINELKTGIYIANVTLNGERKAFKIVKK